MIFEYKKLIKLKSEEGTLSHSECVKLNDYLATLSVEDIEMPDRKNVSEYLLVALNMNSVEIQLIPSLEKLRNDLQESLK
ncbi:hypothetical protein SAMN02746065_12115 [Desulfocicer vacuolatum DSM 3385]|uniref:Uncharacterized protein n=1 Tax=Desulfocicer vacuolatum DSM 3385 TaxID=1121400 RepID=A0A1W2DXR0_9BACT|nr:hypothetical protein [Desulfocicer vacuolatum]SMD01618.1 hypothetical protein SAMN02746065_12115 [Desulfocicer vacuolatum DSM 3385]